MRYFVLMIVLISCASGLDVDLNCPRSVFVGEEFSCSVEVDDGDSEYDLKVEVDSSKSSALEILDGSEWKSSYYYLSEFVEDEEEVVLRFGDSGEFDFVVKLRDGSFREEFDCGEIRVLENGDLDFEDKDEVNSSQISQMNTDEVRRDGTIELNSFAEEEVLGEEVVFVSREGRVLDLLPYLFCLVLIGLVGILVWERF